MAQRPRRPAAAAAVALVAAAAAGGCGGEGPSTARVAADTLTVYASVPTHGPDAAAGAAAARGMRRALQRAGGRAGGRRVRLVALSSTRPGDTGWDPGTVEANAERAADDASAIAYLGELDQGATAVSLPVTNSAGILQVSPADGLTSLTRTPPGRPRAGPERYYPDELRTFVRLVPPDLEAAREIVRRLRARRIQRLTILHGDEIADRELEGTVVALVGSGRPRAVERVALRGAEPGADPATVAELVEETVATRPGAVLYAGAPSRTSAAVLTAVAQRLPGALVIGGPQLADRERRRGRAPAGCALTAVPRRGELPPRGRRLLGALRAEAGAPVPVEAALGYDAMRLVLDAIGAGGPDRSAVVAAARATVRREGLAGAYSIDRRGDADGRSVDCAPSR